MSPGGASHHSAAYICWLALLHMPGRNDLILNICPLPCNHVQLLCLVKEHEKTLFPHADLDVFRTVAQEMLSAA